MYITLSRASNMGEKSSEWGILIAGLFTEWHGRVTEKPNEIHLQTVEEGNEKRKKKKTTQTLWLMPFTKANENYPAYKGCTPYKTESTTHFINYNAPLPKEYMILL